MRLIDADALPITPVDITDLPKDGTALIVYSKENVDNAPTVDTEPIVRCKDCKYCEDESYTDEDTGKEVKYLVCDRWYEQDDADGNMFPKADDFCSKGERK